MNNKSNNKRKILQILCLSIVILGLFISIIFSSISISSNTLFNSRYSGGYQALVEVYDSKKENEEGSSQIANGDASKAAASLENKLSPFSDNTVDIKVVGKNRLAVTSTKEQYGNNEAAFRNAIEQDGGLLALTSDYKDILFDDTTIEKVTEKKVFDENKKIANKIPISDIFGQVKYKPQPDPSGAQKNASFLVFQSGQEATYLDKLVASSSDESTGTTTNQTLTLVSSMQGIINNLREYYSFYSKESELDDYLLSYYKGVIAPIQSIYNNSDDKTKAVLDDLFMMSYQVEHFGNKETKTASLISGSLDFWWSDNNNNHSIRGSDAEVVRQLKGLLYGNYDDPNNSRKIEDYEFKFINSANKYVVDSNSVTKDFTETNGKYYEDFKFTNQSNQNVKINEVADIVNKTLIKEVLMTNIDTNDTTGNKHFNQELRSDIFLNNFIMINDQIDYTSTTASSAQTRSYSKKTSFSQNELKIAMKSATIAKTIEASISQTTSGFNFRVIRLVDFDADVTITMLIISFSFMLILALLAITYLLYFYRLLGVYTLLIAVTSIFVILLTPSIFGIAIGIETITLVFVVLAIIIDSCVNFIESFKKNLNVDKRSQIESFKLANKENTTSIFDLILLVTVTNIIIFWISSGSLKNIATIAVVTTFTTLVLVLIIFRLMFWLSVKGNLFKKNPLLLPLDTSILKNRNAIRSKLKLAKVEYKLTLLTNKDKVSSKQLIKIKKLNDEKIVLENIIVQKEKDFEISKIKKHELKLIKINEKINRNNDIKSTKNTFKYVLNLIKKEKLKTLNASYAHSQTIVQNQSNEVIKKAYEQKQTRVSLKISKMLVILTLILSFVGSIFALTIGPAYSNNFGKENTFIVYGDHIDSFASKQYDEVYNWIAENNKIKAKELQEIKENIITSEATEAQAKLQSAELSAKTVEFIYTNNLTDLFLDKKISKTGNIEVIFGDDYLINGSDGGTAGWIQVRTSNRSSLARNRLLLKKVLVDLNSIWNGSEQENSYTKGILGMNQSPFTAIGQIKQILISLAILLLALVIYIFIRFKWTYYVALALGIIIVGLITSSLVMVFRVPISYELLSTFIAVVSFAILSMIIILGKIRSSIGSKTKDQLVSEFASEIEIKSKLHKIILGKRQSILAITKDLKTNKKVLKFKLVNLKIKKQTRFAKWNSLKSKFVVKFKNQDIKNVRSEIKQLRKNKSQNIKPIKKEIKLIKKNNWLEFNTIIKENIYMKSVLNDTMNHAIKKILMVGLFYLLFAFILVVTIPTIVGVGLTLLIGIFVTYAFIITTAIPLTILLEKRRIAKRFAYKNFIKTVTISQEEQIVKDIND